MRVVYHEHESLDHLLASRMLPGGGDEPIRMAVFGGTGAVGGAAVLELCRLVLRSAHYRDPAWRAEIFATGSSDKEIVKFASRLYMALGDRTTIEKIEPRRHYRIGGRIDLHLSNLRLSLPHELPDVLRAAHERDGETFEPEAVLEEFLRDRPRPFLEFVEALDHDLLHAVLVAIPLPSVAAYTLGALDRVAGELGWAPPLLQRMKATYLRSFIRGLAIVQQQFARHVVIAHTTAVGGMYRVDDGRPEIRLGFAHSALGQKLVDKKFFADELTQLYLDHGFDVLVTAAAIGIDAVDLRTRLPLDRTVQRRLAELAERTDPPVLPSRDAEAGSILLYPAATVALPDLDDGEAPADTKGGGFRFGAGKELTVDAAIRSGENGLFSVANCVALYNVMKVAIPEELAVVLVRHSVFGPERRRDWFQDKICYYTETENSYFALRLLDNHPELDRAHHGAFALQAYQALGSAAHQARLHELGLLGTLLRLLELGRRFPAIAEARLSEALVDLDDFVTAETRTPCFEDLDGLDASQLAQHFGRLCTIESMQDAGRFLGYHPRRRGRREPGRERFLARLATGIRRYLDSIQSLGTPILFVDPATGEEMLRLGPYVAPLDRAIGSAAELREIWRTMALDTGTDAGTIRDWTLVNNGFVDLRPGGLGTDATSPGPDLSERIGRFADAAELEVWLRRREVGSYFTTCGLTPLLYRLGRLAVRLRNRKLELGTRETWKHLFPHDGPGRVVLSPGLIETVRMYQEGLGKITGTECLWPAWGY